MTSIFGDESRFYRDLSADPAELEKTVQELSTRVLDPNEPAFNGFDEEFCFLEYQTANGDSDPDLYKSANLMANRGKNRYSNVLPKEHSRVKLNTPNSEEGEDYINANYIDGLIEGSEKEYITTQGPLYTTFDDFWRMVWEQKSCVIVMLTKEMENDRHKCDRYWPGADMPLTTEHHTVVLLDAYETDELTERKLQLVDNKSGDKRIVWQFQYTAWPDHDLPTANNPMGAFLDLSHKVDKVNVTHGPLVVHCSAGIGRSGTFCAVHSIIEKIRLDLKSHPEEIPHFSILKTILGMRYSRPGMVQTKDQYMFCYLTLLEESRRLMKKGHVWNNGAQKEKVETYVDSSTSEDESEYDSEVENRSRNSSNVDLATPERKLASAEKPTSSTLDSGDSKSSSQEQKQSNGLSDLQRFSSTSLPDRVSVSEEEQKDVSDLIRRFEEQKV